MAKYYVILDAGHAKNTGGKRNTLASPDFYEWDFNNKLQYKLKKRLETLGIVVYLTNPTPDKVSDIPLTTRANKANAQWKSWGKPSNCIFISLHGNASSSCSSWQAPRGVEVFYASNASAKSKELALLLTNQIYKDVHAVDSGFKNRGRKCSNFTVIYKTQCKSVLIEHGFYDNKADLGIMVNKMDLLVEADVKAICSYFKITYKKPQVVTPPKPSPPKPAPSTNFLVRVLVDELNIRQDANFDSKVVGTASKGEVFTVVAQKNGLYKLKSGAGWISAGSKFVKKV